MTDLFRNLRQRANARLAELETKTDAILADGAQSMAATARRRSVDPEVRASIITVGPVTDKRGRRTVIVVAGDESTIETTADGKRYQKARLQEFGTRHRPALPFMRPAYRDNISKVRARLGIARREFVKKLFSGQ